MASPARRSSLTPSSPYLGGGDSPSAGRSGPNGHPIASPAIPASRLAGNFGAFNFGGAAAAPSTTPGETGKRLSFSSRSGVPPGFASPSSATSMAGLGASVHARPPPGLRAAATSSAPQRSAAPPTPTAIPNAETAQLVQNDIPLQNRWSFWLDTFNSAQHSATEYEKHLRVVCTVGTVQEFWGAVNNMRGPETLENRHCYHFMKEGIKPTWEDPRNQEGGSYVFRIKKPHTSEVWRDLLLLLIGEQLQDCIAADDEICGVSISSRWNSDLFQIWHGNIRQTSPRVMNHVREYLAGVELQSQYYKAHRDHSHFKNQSNESSAASTPITSSFPTPAASASATTPQP
ncbi:hypothetical protein IWQ60_002265 [Tieghemiomyces parasiticus]|uniref:Uncharacterized protein n=1 Tax=Tieghemiomyces parasiticus TaxID=78921 RepID=A0A9W8E148_9FUNG|nr:hypothetical protein IWQ60_002265 [Tieghemiomyces parasiticus]